MAKYYCEYCSKIFHNPVAAMLCTRTPLCAGLTAPPASVQSEWKIRGCAIILADTAADMVLGSPAARTQPVVREKALRIKKWTTRLYEALKANTPMSKGVINRIHRDLSNVIFKRVWEKGKPLPNLVALDLASRYAEAARVYVQDRIEATEGGEGPDDGRIHSLWFQQEHPEWLANGAIAMPLALYISGMKVRRMTSKIMDECIVGWKNESNDEDRPTIMHEMLDHCWRDELRSWRFLEGAIDAMIKWVMKHGTEDSIDIERFNVEEGFEALLEFIWDQEKKPKKNGPAMKAWLVDGRFWIAAPSRAEAKNVLLKETGMRGKKVQGFDHAAKLWDPKTNGSETVAELLGRYKEPQLIGTTG